jgi:hypothetical protein
MGSSFTGDVFSISQQKKSLCNKFFNLFLAKFSYFSKKKINSKLTQQNLFTFLTKFLSLDKTFYFLIKHLSLGKTNNFSWLNFYLSTKLLCVLSKLLFFGKTLPFVY